MYNHLDGNQSQNGKCVGPFLQTQDTEESRFREDFQDSLSVKNTILSSQFGKGHTRPRNSERMKKEVQTKKMRVHTQREYSLEGQNQGSLWKNDYTSYMK